MYPGEIYVGTKERYCTPDDFVKALLDYEPDVAQGLPNNLVPFIKSGCAKWTLGYNPELDNEPHTGWYELIEYDTKNKGVTPIWYIKIVDQSGNHLLKES